MTGSKNLRPPYKLRGSATWALVREAYLQGASAAACAERFDVTVAAIRKRITQEGWSKGAYAEAVSAPLPPPAPRPDPFVVRRAPALPPLAVEAAAAVGDGSIDGGLCSFDPAAGPVAAKNLAVAGLEPAQAARALARRAVQAAEAGRVVQARELARLAESLARVGARLAPLRPATMEAAGGARAGEEEDEDDDLYAYEGRDEAALTPGQRRKAERNRRLIAFSLTAEGQAVEAARQDWMRSNWPLEDPAEAMTEGERAPDRPPCGGRCALNRVRGHIAAVGREKLRAFRGRQGFADDDEPTDGDVLDWAAMARSLGVRTGDARFDDANLALAAPAWARSLHEAEETPEERLADPEWTAVFEATGDGGERDGPAGPARGSPLGRG